MPTPEAQRTVPWRTIFATIFSVIAVYAAVLMLRELQRIITWILIAGFFAVILTPAVDFLVQRAKFRRAPATLLVFVAGFALLVALMYSFIRPLVDQATEFADNFPEYVADAKSGEGPIGRLVQRYDLDQRFEDNQDRFREWLNSLGNNSVDIVRGVGNAVAAGLTIMVLAFLMIMRGPGMIEAGLNVLLPHTRERVRAVGADCSRAITGYMAGNLLISVVAGAATYIFLRFAGVPFALVLALWVAFADLIPMVGATLGAIPTIGVAFLAGIGRGIAALVFYVLYQQFENHVLQPTVMSRTVDLNPLVVLVSVLAGVELFGILGALLAIPVAGIVQVIARDLWDEHRGRLKAEPTTGADETAISETADIEARAKEAS